MTPASNLAAVAALSLIAGTAPGAESAQAWLDRMTRAAQSLNYDGTFVYRNGGVMESMRIIHKADAQGERSRMVALSGAKREVIRDRSRVVCILPDDEQVVVTKRRPPSPFSANLLEVKEGFDNNYELRVRGGDRVAGRATEVLDLVPHDAYRYGYRLWVDRETGLLLKSDLLSEAGPLEQFLYTSIEMHEDIPDSLLEPGISGQSLTWHISADPAPAAETAAGSAPGRWQVQWMPEGFMMSEHGALPVPSGRMPVEHYVYTDGLAALSVFIERLDTSEPLEGLSAMGALNAFGVLIDDFQVTVVGEVPARTVEQIAHSVTQVSD